MSRALLAAPIALVIVPLTAYAAININTASQAALESLPGIGPAKAAAVIEYRTVHGPFLKSEDLVLVKGIGPATYTKLKALITVSGGESIVVQPSSVSARSHSVQEGSPEITSTLTTNNHGSNGVVAPGASSTLDAPGALVATPAAASSGRQSWLVTAFGFLVFIGAAVLIL